MNHIHTHFESLYDTGNNLETMLDEFVASGATLVADTEHGDFTAFEDLNDLCKDRNDIDVIPGVEGYLNTFKDDSEIKEGAEDRNHLILIAKNKEGYKELSNIITQSNYDHDKRDRAVITWKNLEENVTPGNIYCTTACIAGPLGSIFQDAGKEAGRRSEKYRSRLRYIDEKFGPEGKNGGIDYILQMDQQYKSMSDNERKTLSDKDKTVYKANNKLAQAILRDQKKIDEFAAQVQILSTEEKYNLADTVVDHLFDIFGKENVFFEIQNHDTIDDKGNLIIGIEKEHEVYPEIVRYTHSRGYEDHLIASNDIHIGKRNSLITKDDLERRNIAKFSRFNTYTPDEPWEKEIGIKNDEEIYEELKKLDIDEQDIKTAMKNVDVLLRSCDLSYLHTKDKDHYPKFCDDENEMFTRLVEKGVKLKFPNGLPNEEYRKRIEYEEGIVKSMGYAGYHLIVQDYLDYARNLGRLPEKAIPYAPENLNKLKQAVSEMSVFEKAVKKKKESLPALPEFISEHISTEELINDIRAKRFSVKSLNIGPGRGSGAGSLCCYLLGITDIDPLKYGLIFERFLNPERVSMPDIDCDFRTDIRDKCISYCANRYGDGNTSKIITKTYEKISGALRRAARYIGNIDYETQIDKEEQILNPTNSKTDFMKKYLAMGDHLAKKVNKKTGEFEDPESLRGDEKRIYEAAQHSIGLYTGFGQHAAGNIISKDKISDIIPLKWAPKKENYSTQCTMAQAEAKGLLKMDFLGLENLDILTEIIRRTGDDVIADYSKRDELLSDEKAMTEIFDRGLTQGVFQFESDGMKKMLTEFRPDTFEDLILLVAAYRPGPLQYLDGIIKVKKYQDGRDRRKKPDKIIKIDNKTLDSILEPTYGAIIYQEQIMKICTDLAGYTLGQADNVRKYMSKKKADKLEHEKDSFINGDPKRGIDGCVKRGMSKEDAEKLFEQMMDFASYAFNKSHATAYALVSFFTAYYKIHYPAVFYEISLQHADLSDVPAFRSEMSHFHCILCPPDINHSVEHYKAYADKASYMAWKEKKQSWFDKYIYMGYGDIKGCSSFRLHKEPTLYELIVKAPVTVKMLSTVAKTGALDVYGNRNDVVSYIDTWAEKIRKYEDAIERQKTETDKRKLAGINRTLKNIGEIPVFVSTSKKTVDYGVQYELLDNIFLSKDQMSEMNGSLSKVNANRQRMTLFLVSVENKAQKNKFGDGIYYNAYFMDKNSIIKRYFVSDRLPSGLYDVYISEKPWSTKENIYPHCIQERESETIFHASDELQDKMIEEMKAKIDEVSKDRVEGDVSEEVYVNDEHIGTVTRKELDELKEIDSRIKEMEIER